MKQTLIHEIIKSLAGHAADIEAQWTNPTGTKTRHFVIDAFLPQDIAVRAYSAFPRDGQGFLSRATFREKKSTSASLADYDPLLADITYALQDPEVVAAIGGLTQMRDLEPDPDLSRGGLSMMFSGDYLNPHIDNSHDAQRNRYRRLNILYYVSPEWNLANGGNFELWDDARKTPKTIVATQNRLVVMETTKLSWHSVSKVNAESARCCVSNYYYSMESPDGDDYYHVTSFDGRPEEPLKKGLSKVDNVLRGVVSKITGKARG